MGELIAEVLPLALAVALSPFPIIPAILLLFTKKPRAAGFSFLAGWVVGVLGSTILFVLLAALIELADEPPTWASWTRIALGALLIAVGIRQVMRRSESSETPAWMASIDSLEPAGAMRLGIILSAANPKVLLLTAAAGLTVGSEQAGFGPSAFAVLVFTVIASIHCRAAGHALRDLWRENFGSTQEGSILARTPQCHRYGSGHFGNRSLAHR